MQTIVVNLDGFVPRIMSEEENVQFVADTIKSCMQEIGQELCADTEQEMIETFGSVSDSGSRKVSVCMTLCVAIQTEDVLNGKK